MQWKSIILIYILIILLLFSIFHPIILSFFQNNLFWKTNIKEGLQTKIQIKGSINQNVLTLDTPTCISQGSFLQTMNNEYIVDISHQPIYIGVGSTIRMDKYGLSGFIDPSGKPYIPLSKSIPLQILTSNPCPKADILVNGNLTGVPPVLSLTRPSNYTIYPGYLLFSSGGNPIKDKLDKQIIIVSGNDLSYKLSGEPVYTTNTQLDFIIREP
jgi:hypothetical protein